MYFLYILQEIGHYTETTVVIQKDAEPDIRDNQERRKTLGTACYADRAVQKFIADMQKVYPDAFYIFQPRGAKRFTWFEW